MNDKTNEIIFRGKTTPKTNSEEFNGIWIEGDLVHSKGLYYIHPISNYVKVQSEIGRLIVMHEIIPETLGRYTSKHDKNGKKIFEGDIIEDDYGHREVVVYYEKHACFGSFWGKHFFPLYTLELSIFEIIGNIHDDSTVLSKGGEAE